jgi:hypothetical protein
MHAFRSKKEFCAGSKKGQKNQQGRHWCASSDRTPSTDACRRKRWYTDPKTSISSHAKCGRQDIWLEGVLRLSLWVRLLVLIKSCRALQMLQNANGGRCSYVSVR